MPGLLPPARPGLWPSAIVVALPQRPAFRSFNVQERMRLVRWQHAGLGGYSRLLIQDELSGTADGFAYALVYEAGEPWARWGFAPCAAGIEALDCRYSDDPGEFPDMDAAIAALPPPRNQAVHRLPPRIPPAVVVPFVRRATLG